MKSTAKATIVFLFLAFALIIVTATNTQITQRRASVDVADRVLVRNSSGSFFLFVSDSTGTYLEISDDNGFNWRNTSASPLGCELNSTSVGTGALLINSSNDHIIVCDDGSDVVSAYTTDNGVTWSTSHTIDFWNWDTGGATIDGNDNILVCVNTGGQTNVYNSSDSGTTWTETNANPSADDGCDIETDLNGMYHLAGIDTSTDDIFYTNTTNPTSWGTSVTVDDGSAQLDKVAIAVNPSNSDIYILARTDTIPSQQVNLSIFNSTDGQSWTETIIATGVESGTVTHWDIKVGEDGMIYVVATHNIGQNLRYFNTTDPTNWPSPQIIATANGTDILEQAGIRGGIYPRFNNISTSLEIMYFNGTSQFTELYRLVYADTENPTITIDTPANNSIHGILDVDVNYSFVDDGVADTCWYSEDGGLTNVTIASCTTDVTEVDWTEGENTVTIYGNDTAGNIGQDSVTFTISLDPPTITLNEPANNSFLNYLQNIEFNYTPSDPNDVSNCSLYHNFDGTFQLNQTDTSITVDTLNSFTVTTDTDGEYLWGVECTDTTNDINQSINFTVTLDTTLPLIADSDIEITTTNGSQNVEFNLTGFTEINCNNTFYSVFDSTASIENGLENISLTSCTESNGTFTVAESPPASFNLTIYMRDKAGNENSTTKQFNITQVIIETGGGGGGGGGGGASQVPVIGIQDINSTQLYTTLERAIIYATINNYCSELISSEPFAISDLSGECRLTAEDLEQIILLLEEYNVEISIADLTAFFQNYKNQLLFQGFATQDEVTRFNLFVSNLGLTTLLQINPPSVDKYVFVFEPEGNALTVPVQLTTNKPLKSCEVISETPNVMCEYNESLITVGFDLENTEFSSRVFTSLILVTTDAPNDEIEQRQVSVVIRVVNMYRFIPFFAIGITGLVAFIFVRRRRKKAIKLKDLIKI